MKGKFFVFVIFLVFFGSSKIFTQSIGEKVQVSNSNNEKAEVQIAVDPNNPQRMFIATMKLGTDKKSRVGYFYSNDGGVTWNGSDQIHSHEQNDDPTVSYDLNGNVYLCYFRPWLGSGAHAAIYIEKSTDNGATWLARTQLGGTNPYYIDKPFLAIDNNNNSPYKNRKYVFWVNTSSDTWRIYFSSSVNFGIRKKVVEINNKHLMGPFASVGPNGELYMIFNINHPNCTGIGFTKSTDGGQTFTPYKIIATVRQIGTNHGNYYLLNNNNIKVITNPTMAIDPVDGTIYVTYQSKGENGDSDVFLVKSADNGENWGEPKKNK